MRNFLLLFMMFSISWLSSCSKTGMDPPPNNGGGMMEEEEEQEEALTIIDLNNWKVTLPVGNPTEVEPPEILDYHNNEILKDFMFNDNQDSSLVFYTYPGSTTSNTSYSRTELREQMESGSNKTNWTFGQGGRIFGKLKLDEISKESNNDFHRTIVMQIHGRLTDEQKDELGQDDNNAPPILKIYWQDNRIRVIRKIMVDVDETYPDILLKNSWKDEAMWFDEIVAFEPFTLEVDVKDSEMKIILNNSEEMIFDDIHTEKWGVFENYFKAGNYLQSLDENAFARVKYYELEVTH